MQEVGDQELAIWRRKGQPGRSNLIPRTDVKSPAERWADEQNYPNGKPSPPPPKPEPPKPVETEQDRRDKQDGIKCLLVGGGTWNGKAVAEKVAPDSPLHPARRYAPEEIHRGTGPYQDSIYQWAERRPDGVNIYKHAFDNNGW
jgi:hypothetical protein